MCTPITHKDVYTHLLQPVLGGGQLWGAAQHAQTNKQAQCIQKRMGHAQGSVCACTHTFFDWSLAAVCSVVLPSTRTALRFSCERLMSRSLSVSAWWIWPTTLCNNNNNIKQVNRELVFGFRKFHWLLVFVLCFFSSSYLLLFSFSWFSSSVFSFHLEQIFLILNVLFLWFIIVIIIDVVNAIIGINYSHTELSALNFLLPKPAVSCTLALHFSSIASTSFSMLKYQIRKPNS